MFSKKKAIAKHRYFYRLIGCIILVFLLIASAGLPSFAQKEPPFPLDEPQPEELEPTPPVPLFNLSQ